MRAPRTLWAAGLRHLTHRPAQLVLALLGLILGVATVTAVDLAAASAGRAFELSASAVSGSATQELTAGPGGIDEALFVRLSAQYPQLAFAPLVTGYVSVGAQTLQLLGLDPLSAAGFRGRAPGTGVRQYLGGGREGDALAGLRDWLLSPGAALMQESTARRLGLARGAHFSVAVAGRTEHAVLLDVLGAQAGADALLLVDIATAQEWLEMPGRLSAIEVEAPASAASLLRRLQSALPPGVSLASASERARTGVDMTQAFTINLRAMSLLALLVGVLLIYSAMSFAVLQRRRTFAVLRALGATRGELLRGVLAEAAVLGITGAALGVLAGSALAHALLQLVSGTINDLYFVVEATQVALTPATLVKALVAGVLTAVLAAVVPALEAAHVAPQLGLRRSVLEERALRAARRLLLTAALLLIAAALVIALSRRSLLAGFTGLFLLLVSVAALTPAWLRFCARRAARLAGRWSAVAALGLEDVGASLSRTGVAVAALGVALAAMLGVAVMVASFRESLRDWLASTMRADVYVAAPGPGFGRPERRLDPQVIAALLAVPGVRDHRANRNVSVDSAAGPIALTAVTLPAMAGAGVQLVGPTQADVWRAFGAGALLVAEPLAWRARLAPGSYLTLPTPHGPHAFPVAGIYREYGDDRGGVLMARRIYEHWWNDDAVTSLGLYLDPGARPDEVIARLLAAAAGRQALYVSSSAELRALSLEIFEHTFLITRVLNWLTAGVAAVGLLSALLAWELERGHEIALLRALGLSRGGAASLIEAQTGFLGLVALSAAIPAGLLAAWLLVAVINRRAFGWQLDFHLHAAQLLDALLVAVVAALAAGAYPAWRAGRATVALALREE
ncbi:MAG TPA: ABC transporter permease [Steroidobacteraceae bacterium]|nr:ABC transporter permease [Steroidobacteraceae bacterium]